MKLLILFMVFVSSVSCTMRSAGVSKELQTRSDTYEVHTNPKAQYNKAIQMVSKSTEFSENQKNKLNQLIGEYTIKSQDLKIKQSQYRAVLISEMLESDKKTKLNTKVTKDSLAEINYESSKNLEAFIKEFQKIAGGAAKTNQALILQTLDI